MRRASAWTSVLALLLWAGTEVLARRHQPRFFSMDRETLAVAQQEAVGAFSSDDEKEKHILFLLSDREGRPLLFFADITISVCLDEVCNPVRIELYWDLVGDYAGYGVVPGFPLEKYDAVPFEPADYAKLHRILSDRNSILGERSLGEMIEPAAQPTAPQSVAGGATPDAVSGATTQAVRNAIVPGALYSCHALWNLAHGEIRDRMRDHLRSLFDSDLARSFLLSDSPDYQAHALAETDEEFWTENLPRILDLFAQSGPSVRALILEKLPGKAWRDEEVVRVFYQPFAKMDAETKAILIEKLDRTNGLAKDILADRIESMTKAQLLGYLDSLATKPERLGERIRAELHRIAAADRYAYSYVIDEFLRERAVREPVPATE